MLVSLFVHRNWYQPLACNVVALVPLFANTFAVSGVVGRACGQLADLHRSVVVLSTLTQNFSQALCVRDIWKNNKAALRVCPLSEKQRHGLFSREEERFLAYLTGLPCCHGSTFMLYHHPSVQGDVGPGSLHRMEQCLPIA